MKKQSNTGIYQLPNGNWAYRFTQTVNGKRHNHKSVKDENGQPMRSQKAAIKARQLAIIAAEAQKNEKPRRRVTFAEVYQEYCDKGRSGKAYTTIRKQDSLWKNHLSAKFGARFIDTISVAEVNDYLSELYYTEGRAYRYVEGFLKMFYLIFGQAYSRNYLNVDAYNKLCVNKDVRISMPKMRIDEDTNIVAYSREQVEQLDGYFHGTNAETAYMLGRWCGLRINECYGLKWENVDFKGGTITVDRQMQYQEGLIKLVPLKTRNARRTVYMSADNDRMINKAALAKMKDGAILINNSRGQLIDEQDVADALKSGKLAAAGLDVVYTEPIRKDNPLLEAPNCLITPHMSWGAKEARQRIMDTTVENVRAYMNGSPVHVVNQ